MSQKSKNKSNFQYTPTHKLPKLKKTKETWDLARFFYTSPTDPAIEKDLQKTERAIKAFAKKYQDGAWTKDKESIVSALMDYLKLQHLPGSKSVYYLSYRTVLDAEDQVAEKLLNRIEERLTKLGNELLFFELALAKLPKHLQKALLSDEKLTGYHHYFDMIFEAAKHQLTEPEERILSLKSSTSHGLWIAGTEKIQNKKTITWKGKEMPLNGALMEVEHLPRAERHRMWSKIVPVVKEIAEVAENELVALVINKKINDELRGYEKPYSATTQAYESTDETLERLVSVIETKGYDLSNRFFKLKKKLLGKKMDYIDRNEPIGKAPKITYKTAVEIVRDVYYGFDPYYGEIFDEMLQNGQIDVWPKKGKGSGAFCSSGIDQPTFVLLNQNDSIDSLRTIAHEMGHAVHAYRSKKQPAHYEGHSILTAETASTFFESLVSEHLIDQATGKDKLIFLHNSIADRLMTLVMCISRFKAELEIHQTIRHEGGMSWPEMADCLAKHLGDYVGPAIKTTQEDGMSVFTKTHYRRNFYQYSYSFGEIGSSILRKRYHEDNSYAKEVDRFLCLGESDTVENIFAAVDIDMTKDETFLEGLQIVEDDIDLLEQLTRHK